MVSFEARPKHRYAPLSVPPLFATRALRSIKRPPLPVVRRLAAAPSQPPPPRRESITDLPGAGSARRRLARRDWCLRRRMMPSAAAVWFLHHINLLHARTGQPLKPLSSAGFGTDTLTRTCVLGQIRLFGAVLFQFHAHRKNLL